MKGLRHREVRESAQDHMRRWWLLEQDLELKETSFSVHVLLAQYMPSLLETVLSSKGSLLVLCY